ncbi:MAG TPA: glycosyltransferase family 2 protein [Blastocatellia bacterium]|nr:glycosyltransferase family 2 protein [Blastocatellia bacterium]
MKIETYNLPLVSVIMPIRNEAAFIERSLAAVLAQDYPPDLIEVLVVDGMSDDGTREIVQRMIYRRHDSALYGGRNGNGSVLEITNNISPIYLLDNPGRIVPTGLNSAIRQARGEVIVIVGGHAIIERDYVRSCVESLLRTGTDCVGGALDSIGIGYIGTAIAAAMSSPFGVGSSGFRVATVGAEPTLTDSVPFPAYRHEVFKRVGLYNELMVRHQDYEFNYRLRKAGGKILLLPSMRVKYYVRSNFRSLWRQYWQYGLWKGSFLREHPASLKLRHLIPPLFVLMVAISILLALIPQARVWASWIAPGAYVAFMLAGLIAVSKSGKLRYAPILPFVFACLHFSYGFGIWLGLLSPMTSRNNNLTTLKPEDAVNRSHG